MRSRIENVNLSWEDIELKKTSTGDRFLELSERATKLAQNSGVRAFATKNFADKGK